jgi:hypothetical protein
MRPWLKKSVKIIKRDVFMKKIAILLQLIVATSFAYETDQISASFYDLKDSEMVIDQIVTDGIQDSISNWSGVRDDHRLMKLIFKKFSSREFERWVNESVTIDSRNAKGDSIYKTTGYLNSPIIRLKGLASTINMNGVLLGTDKLSHFFGVGRGLYERYKISKAKTEAQREQEALDWSHFTENTYWGSITTGVFSNADLVANYEGYLFYRGLLEDGIANGQKALIRWEGNKPFLQRPFSFRVHINDYWSEALNPNFYRFAMHPKVLAVMRSYCVREDFLKNPDRFQSPHEAVLEAKYKKLLFFRENQRMTLNAICRRFDRWPTEEKEKFLSEEKELIEKYVSSFKNDPVRLSDRAHNIEDLIQPIPGCRAQIMGGAAEFDMMQAWSKTTSTYVNTEFQKRIELQRREILQNLTSEMSDTATLKIFALVLGRDKTDSIQLGQDAKTGTRIAKTKYQVGFRKELPMDLSLSYLGPENLKICQLHAVEGLPEKTTEIRLSGCFILNANSPVQEAETMYRLTNKYRSRVSQKGYYDMSDRNGFIYRSIHDVCKWY